MPKAAAVGVKRPCDSERCGAGAAADVEHPSAPRRGSDGRDEQILEWGVKLPIEHVLQHPPRCVLPRCSTALSALRSFGVSCPRWLSSSSQQCGLPASALRFYEEKGLIESIGRRGLRRVFPASVIERLALIALGRSDAPTQQTQSSGVPGPLFQRRAQNRRQIVEHAKEEDIVRSRTRICRDAEAGYSCR